jgi:hypothetical protein
MIPRAAVAQAARDHLAVQREQGGLPGTLSTLAVEDSTAVLDDMAAIAQSMARQVETSDPVHLLSLDLTHGFCIGLRLGRDADH